MEVFGCWCRQGRVSTETRRGRGDDSRELGIREVSFSSDVRPASSAVGREVLMRRMNDRGRMRRAARVAGWLAQSGCRGPRVPRRREVQDNDSGDTAGFEVGGSSGATVNIPYWRGSRKTCQAPVDSRRPKGWREKDCAIPCLSEPRIELSSARDPRNCHRRWEHGRKRRNGIDPSFRWVNIHEVFVEVLTFC